VRLEILDAQGNLIRAFSSEAAPGDPPGNASQGAQGSAPPVPVQAAAPKVEAGAGMHRFIWDLAYPGPWDPDPRRSGTGGPLAPPGTYQVRLTAGGWSETRSFRVLMDPRIAKDGVTLADLEDQLALSLEVRDAIGQARLALERIREAKRAQPANSDVWRRLDAVESQLATDTARGIRYPQPMLIDQFLYLYRMITQSDQRVGRDGFERYSELRKLLDDLLRQVAEIATQTP
jgi:hypothetical protein